jgi:hypothetical protein
MLECLCTRQLQGDSMPADPIVSEETRNREGIAYVITIRGKSGRYHSTVECPLCGTTESVGSVATKVIAIKEAQALLDTHHTANHRVGMASLR